MRAHPDIQKMLAVYPSLDDMQRRIVDEHVGRCRACAEARSAYQALDQQVAALDDSPLPPALWRKWSTLGAAEHQPRGFYLWLTPVMFRRVALPLVLLLILTCGLWLLMHLSSPRPPGIAETPSVTPTATPAVMAARRSVTLAMVAREPDYSPSEASCSPTALAYPAAVTAPTTETPAASEIAASATALGDRQN